MRCEVHDGVHLVLPHDASDQFGVGHVAHNQFPEHRVREAGRQVIEHNDSLAGLIELAHDMTSDVAGSACHQHRFLTHARLSLGSCC